MDPQNDLDFAIGWNRYILRFLGLWPEFDGKRKSSGLFARYRFLVAAATMLFFVTGPQCINLIFVWGDLDPTVENLATANIPITTALLKLLVFRYHQEDLKPVIRRYTNDWLEVDSEEHRAALLKTAKLSRRISIGCYALTKSMVLVYTCLRIAMNLQAKDGTRLIYFTAYFPYDVFKSPTFELTFLGQFIAALYATSTYSTIDNFICTNVLHVCGQLADLQRRSRNLVSQCEVERERTNDFWKNVVKVVEKHEELIRFTEAIETCFNKALLVQMLACTIQFCFQGFQFMSTVKNGGDDFPLIQLVFLIIYVIVIMAHFFVYCYVGEMLLVESTALAYAAYECSWHKLRAREAKALMFIVYRSRIPLQMTAGKFCVFSLELFGKIIKTSAGYLSVLITVAD